MVRREERGKGVPGGGHSNGDGQGDSKEDNWRGPHGGAVDTPEKDEFVNDENEKQDAEPGDGSSGGWQSDAVPGKAAEGGGDETHGGDQDEPLVRVGPAPSSPRSVDHDGEADDADQWDGSGDGGVERTDPHSAMERVDGGNHAEHDHDRGKAEGDGPEGTVPLYSAGGDKRGLDYE